METKDYNEKEGLAELETNNLDIDWIGLIVKLLNYWKTITIVSFIFAMLGVVYALMTPKLYTVTVTLAPETQGGGNNSSLNGMASMLGLGSFTSVGNDAVTVNLFPEISQSTPFLVQLFDVEVTPYVSPKDLKRGIGKAKSTTLAKYITKEGEERSFLSKIRDFFSSNDLEDLDRDFLDISNLTKKQRLLVKAIKEMIVADVGKKPGMITVGVTIDDPWIATTLADTVCNRLQNYVIAYKTSKQQDDLDYYIMLAEEAKEKMIKAQTAYALSVDYDRSVILQSVSSEKERLQQEAQLASQLYTQMEQQVEVAKAKLQEIKPVYTVLEPATMPEHPSSTSRKIVVLVFLFVGFCLSSAWKLFGENFYLGFINEIKSRKNTENIENAQESSK